LVEAERQGAPIRTEKRDEHFRERLAKLALEASDKGYEKLMTRREKKVWYRWQGYWPDSQTALGNDKFSVLVSNTIRHRQQYSFAKRRAQKLGEVPQADPSPSGKGRARVLF
jgi:hypothetical protein